MSQLLHITCDEVRAVLDPAWCTARLSSALCCGTELDHESA